MIWLNGALRPDNEAVISIYDSAVRYGDAVFTMLRTFNGQPFQLVAHCERVLENARTVDISSPWSLSDLVRGYHELSAIWEYGPTEERRTIITISRGPLDMYRALPIHPGPWVMMCQYPLRFVLAGKSHFYRDGVRARVSSVRPVSPDSIPPSVKHLNRLHFCLAERRVAAREPGAWAVLLDRRRRLAEATGANIFVLMDGKIRTPSPRACLPGISRQFVLALLNAHRRWPWTVEDIKVNTGAWSEVFFTCTPFSIVPCTRFNGQLIGDGTPGPVTRALTRAWMEAVQCNFVHQAETWDAERIQSTEH